MLDPDAPVTSGDAVNTGDNGVEAMFGTQAVTANASATQIPHPRSLTG